MSESLDGFDRVAKQLELGNKLRAEMLLEVRRLADALHKIVAFHYGRFTVEQGKSTLTLRDKE